MPWEARLLLISLVYLGGLFAIAYFADRRADSGRSVIANPYVYTLSIAVYCTAWTFYGSVGRAASTGMGFLPIYLGPTLIAVLWWVVLRKMVRISKLHRVTTIADFIASRYGKSGFLAGLVTVIAVGGIMPYVALQLKAVRVSFEVLRDYLYGLENLAPAPAPVRVDTALVVAVLLAAFAILFGTRHIDASERHEGMVAAVAFESVVKLVAFLAVGIFATFGVFDGFADIFARAEAAGLGHLLSFEAVPGGYGSWFSLTVLSMFAVLFLPRQFQVMVVENVNERHIRTAAWLFPLYLLVINLFVLPIALAGLLRFEPGSVDADLFVLALPIAEGAQGLGLLVFLGGLSAATGMVIVASIALSTMICNDLVMPVLLRTRLSPRGFGGDFSRLLIHVRRAGIVFVILLGYLYYRLIGESYALVSIGLVSFAAAAQFAPAILLGLYWRRAHCGGAMLGLCGGFLVWAYTLLLPSFARSGWLPATFLSEGPLGVELLRPYALFGLQGLDPISHAMFWSLLVNVLGLVLGSMVLRPRGVDQVQAALFVDVFRGAQETPVWRGAVTVGELRELVGRFLGKRRAGRAFAEYARRRDRQLLAEQRADPELLGHAELLLTGAIGAASARVMLASVVKGEVPGIPEVMAILEETSQLVDYSHRLEEKSEALEAATAELKAANERLQELDRLKDDFISTVTHELRTPLTSIRAFAEILAANPELPVVKRQEFLGILVKEAERLTRLINQVLDLNKLESGRAEWHFQELDLREVAAHAAAATSQLFQERGVELRATLPDTPVHVRGDADRLTQVVINLLSNAVKFCSPGSGRVELGLASEAATARLWVQDNGPGIAPAEQSRIFDKFHQVPAPDGAKPQGTGLGLTITQRIVERHGGRIRVSSEAGQGATFTVELGGAASGGDG